MGVPTHDSSCITFIKNTHCGRCGQSVYYFQCSHGSKVFFETIGYPWRPHFCDFDVIDDTIEELLTQGYSEKEILNIIYKKGVPDEAKREVIEDKLGRKTNKQIIKEISNLGDEWILSGKVISVNPKVNLLKRLNISLDDNLKRSLAGDLAIHMYDEIILRSKPDKRNIVNEYHIYLRHELKTKCKITVGNEITTPIKKINTLSADLWEIEYNGLFWGFDFDFTI
ncbi:MAG TPA: hypothetical protein PKN15_14195 [Chitinophagales bacterium]|nr:hypothetical protein [Chitinophagales bacterium]